MILIKLFWILSALFLTQVHCEDLSVNEADYKNIIDIAKALLETLEKIVDSISNVSLTTLDSLESVIRSLEDLVLKIAEEAINILGDEIFKKLDELKKEANTIEVDIIDCTEDREGDLKQLLVTFLNTTGDCAVKRVNEVLDSLKIVVVDIQNANEEVKNVTLQLENCEQASNTTACITEVIKDIERESTEIPIKINKDIQDAKKRVDELVNYLFECEHDTINELEKTSQEIYNGIVECVEGKILYPIVVNVP